MNDLAKMRLDKWLKIARIYKQRNKAAQAVDNGNVEINGERVKPAKLIKAGDRIKVRKPDAIREGVILDLAFRSVSAEKARELVEWQSSEKTTRLKGPMKDFQKIWREQQKLNRKEWRLKPDKKKLREMRKWKYGE